MNFPSKLYQIIEQESEKGIIEWNETGLAFRINNHKRLEIEVLPKHFKHSHFTSVKRQLNLYGFKFMHRGENKGCFYNPQFKRGSFEAAKSIVRYSVHKKKAEIAVQSSKPAVSSSDKSANVTADSISDDEGNAMRSTLTKSYNITSNSSISKQAPTRGSTGSALTSALTAAPTGQMNTRRAQAPAAVPSSPPAIFAPVAAIPLRPATASLSSSFGIGNGIFRPSVLTSRIGFNHSMMQPSISRPDRDNMVAGTSVIPMASLVRASSFEEIASLKEGNGIPGKGLTKNNMSIDDLLQFLASENQIYDKGEIPNAFNLW